MPDEEETKEARDPVNCLACRAQWIADTRAVLDAIEADMDPHRPDLLPVADTVAVAHNDGVKAHTA